MTKIYTVSEFNSALNEMFEEIQVAVEGEVSEFKVSQNKWLFFNLKDEEGILRCFATVFQIKNPILEDGLKVRVYGYPKIHSKSGNFSFTVLKVEPVGEGALKRAYEILKNRLETEGLFAPERKRALPRFPQTIGLIASKDSAAYSDFIKILKARWGGLKIHLINVAVQGQEAVPQIVGAFQCLNESNLEFDLVALIRGGGSLEDLRAFNSEEVVRAIFGSCFPVVVGVGHERDDTLADFAADLRASTPSNAAELIVPDKEEVRREFETAKRGFIAAQRFWFEEKAEAIEDSVDRLKSIIGKKAADFSASLANFFHQAEIWRKDLVQKKIAAANCIFRMELNFKKHVQEIKNRLNLSEKIILALNPESLLARGYAVVFKDGKAVRSANELDIDDNVRIKLFKGGFWSKVLKKE